MNKEQIEEMAKKMKQCYEKYGLLNFKWFAEAIYNAGYRKVPECAIILTKEEYDKLGLFEETVQEYKSDKCQPVLVKERKTLKKYPTDIVDFIRKETAKEFAEKLKEICLQRGEWDEDRDDMNPEYFNIGRLCIEDIDRLLKEYKK